MDRFKKRLPIPNADRAIVGGSREKAAKIATHGRLQVQHFLHGIVTCTTPRKIGCKPVNTI
jgi:hypothetical protein